MSFEGPNTCSQGKIFYHIVDRKKLYFSKVIDQVELEKDVGLLLLLLLNFQIFLGK